MEDNNFNGQDLYDELHKEETTQEECQATADELAQTKDQLVRLGADFQNYKKRVEKDRSLWTQTTRAELLLQLLPIVDDFDRAMQESKRITELTEQTAIQSTSVGSSSLNQFLQGYELIHKMFYDYLKKNGVTPIAQHTTFDPELHEAVMQTQAEGKQEGDIITVLQPGFMCNGVVLRHSKVSVAAQQ